MNEVWKPEQYFLEKALAEAPLIRRAPLTWGAAASGAARRAHLTGPGCRSEADDKFAGMLLMGKTVS